MRLQVPPPKKRHAELGHVTQLANVRLRYSCISKLHPKPSKEVSSLTSLLQLLSGGTAFHMRPKRGLKDPEAESVNNFLYQKHKEKKKEMF